MLFNRSIFSQYNYRLNKPNGNFEYNVTAEQLIYRFGDVIANVFPLFSNLPHRFKLNFCKRTLKFLKHYAFVARDGANLTTANKISIAATYIKLTLGYSNYLINAFDTIIVYPTAKFFPNLNETHTGHFNPKLKVIMLSLDTFEKDMRCTADGKNLALHEFTHALCFEMLQSNALHPDADDFKNGFRLINSWMDVVENTIKVQQMEFLRDYAYSNKLELVSVLIELFFEKEQLFKNTFPQLYYYTGMMIKHPKNK